MIAYLQHCYLLETCLSRENLAHMRPLAADVETQNATSRRPNGHEDGIRIICRRTETANAVRTRVNQFGLDYFFVVANRKSFPVERILTAV